MWHWKEGTDLPCLSDGTWTPSRSVMLGWVLCSASLISRAPIIACGGHRSPLHGRGHAALIRGEADWIPRSWKIGDKRRHEGEWVRHLCCQTLQLIEVVVCVWWVQFQSLKPFFFNFYDSKDIKDDFFLLLYLCKFPHCWINKSLLLL